MEKEGVLSAQVGGDHYKMPIQPIEYIAANKLDFFQGNIVKYASRHHRKNKDEDIKKVIHYALFSLQFDYGYTPAQINEVLSSFVTREKV